MCEGTRYFPTPVRRVMKFSDIKNDSYFYYNGNLEKITSIQPEVREFSSIAIRGKDVHIIESCMDDYNPKTSLFDHRKISIYTPNRKHYDKVLNIAQEVLT